MVDRVAVVGAIQAALKADAALSALVGDRVFLLEAPGDEDEPMLPYVVTGRISTRGLHTDNEADGAMIDLTIETWGAYDEGPAVCTTVADAVRDVLNCWGSDDLAILPNTRRISSELDRSDGFWLDRSVYRFQTFRGTTL